MAGEKDPPEESHHQRINRLFGSSHESDESHDEGIRPSGVNDKAKTPAEPAQKPAEPEPQTLVHEAETEQPTENKPPVDVNEAIAKLNDNFGVGQSSASKETVDVEPVTVESPEPDQKKSQDGYDEFRDAYLKKPAPEQKQEREPAVLSPFVEKVIDVAVPAAVGALLEHERDEAEDAGEKTARPPEPPVPPEQPKHTTDNEKTETIDPKKLSFEEIQRFLDDPQIDKSTKEKLGEEKQVLIGKIQNFDHGRPFRAMVMSLKSTLEKSTKDNFYLNADNLASNLDDQLLMGGGDKRVRGAFYQGIMSEVDRIAVHGIDLRGGADRDWLDKNGYLNTDRKEMADLSDKHHIWNLLPGMGWELIGKSLEQTDTSGNVGYQPGNPEFEELNRSLKDLVNQFKEVITSHDKNIMASLEQISNRQAAEFRAAFGGSDPEREKERWIDVEYTQDFFARFQPNQEPKFYTGLATAERQEWDTRWQLARAAYFKKNTASMADKAKENADLTGLSQEILETLYKHERVREMLEGYAQELVNPDSNFWKCKDQRAFEDFRRNLRSRRFAADPDSYPSKEADAIAWNLVYVFNLVESLDSRYSMSGSKHSLPSQMIAGEYRTILHPQENAEGKWASHHNTWGAFGEWGVTQVVKIENSLKFDKSKGDSLEFVPAESSKEFWKSEVREETGSDGRTKRVITVSTPECYPTSQVGSFFEENSIRLPSGDEKSLLDYLVAGEEIPWEEVGNDAAAQYVFGSFNKAVAMMAYFDPGDKPPYAPLEERPRTPWARDWAGPIKELFTRLKPGKTINRLRKEKKTYQTEKNFKKWIVYAAKYKQIDVNKKKPTLDMSIQDKAVLMGALKHKQVKYLKRFEGLNIN